MCKHIFDRDFSTVKKHRREVSIFPEKFKSLYILSKRLKINNQRHRSFIQGQNFWIKPTIFPDFKVYDQ